MARKLPTPAQLLPSLANSPILSADEDMIEVNMVDLGWFDNELKLFVEVEVDGECQTLNTNLPLPSDHDEIEWSN